MKTKFLAPEASELSGVPYTTLVHWDRIELIRPSIRRATGTGKPPRLYTTIDVLSIILIDRMREAGAPVTGLRSIPTLLGDLMGDFKSIDDVNSGLFAVSDGKHVDLLTQRELQAVSIQPGKQTKRYVVDVIDAWKQLKRDVKTMDKDKALVS